MNDVKLSKFASRSEIWGSDTLIDLIVVQRYFCYRDVAFWLPPSQSVVGAGPRFHFRDTHAARRVMRLLKGWLVAMADSDSRMVRETEENWSLR